ncbi:MAG: zinc ribbon domain-containing protein [Acidobacteria bacterium]|nr:zinc ribbon domain-containing protein [Acidobacteriota bacterium]
MPIYEYKCKDCGTKFEKLIRRTEEVAGLGCPSCGEKHLTQEFSIFAAHANSAPQGCEQQPMCPSGGCCNPGMCGMN